MIFVYNFLQAILLVATFPLLLLIVVCKEKYRSRIAGRLSIGLDKKLAHLTPANTKTIWIHSLSVGEVTSALPLVKGIRQEMDVQIIFSASTKTGMKIAQEKISPHVDLIVPAPLDLLPIINRCIKLIRPDMFILVETDFWPNWLHSLHRNKIPLVLVNGRISKASFSRYQRFNVFFRNTFNLFSLLSMQTETDADQMRQLGVSAEKIKTLGNLKYDTLLYTQNEKDHKPTVFDHRIPVESSIWVCGSTHPGEEEIITMAFNHIHKNRKDIFLLLAPRDPNRSEEIQALISNQGLQSMRRTSPSDPEAPVLILDTIGELVDCYRLARVAFIGGSLIDYGGHNPLEASALGVPVLFGPHMSDFLEIAHDLQEIGGAITVDTALQLEETVLQIIDDNEKHQQMSGAARALVKSNSGVIQNHIQKISSML